MLKQKTQCLIVLLLSYGFFSSNAFSASKAVISKEAKNPSQVAKKSAQAKKLRQTKNSKAIPNISQTYIDDSIAYAANKVGIPSELLKAICQVESNLKPHAFVAHDGGSKNHAFGMCQVLAKTAETIIGFDPGCDTNFKQASLPKTFRHCKLFGPKTNALVAAKYLKMQIDRYQGNLRKATAAYNSGIAKTCTTGTVRNQAGKTLFKCQKGGLMNEHYVNKVAKHLPEDFFRNSKLKAQSSALIN